MQTRYRFETNVFEDIQHVGVAAARHGVNQSFDNSAKIQRPNQYILALPCCAMLLLVSCLFHICWRVHEWNTEKQHSGSTLRHSG